MESDEEIAFFASLAVSASLVLAVAPVAAASEGEDLGEQFSQMIPDVTAPKDRVPLDSAAQQQLAEALVTVSELPSVTAAEKLDIQRDIALLNKVNPVLADETRATVARAERLAKSGGPISTMQAVPTLRMLGVTHQAQSNGYFCGPATASMIVRFKGKTHSQATLALPAYLNTTSSAGSRWASGRMASTLNLVLGKEIYQQVQSPSAAALKGDSSTRSMRATLWL